MHTTSSYALPPKQKVQGYVHTDFHDELISYIASYGALTLEWLYWLVYKEPLKGSKYRKGGEAQDPRYLYLAKQLQKLTNSRTIKRSKGLREITYAMKPIGQNFHWLDRNGIQLGSNSLLCQLVTQYMTWFRHEGILLGSPLLHPRFHPIRPPGIDEQLLQRYPTAGRT